VGVGYDCAYSHLMSTVLRYLTVHIVPQPYTQIREPPLRMVELQPLHIRHRLDNGRAGHGHLNPQRRFGAPAAGEDGRLETAAEHGWRRVVVVVVVRVVRVAVDLEVRFGDGYVDRVVRALFVRER